MSDLMSQSELQYASEYLIDECKIISTTGQPFDIIDIVETINFYEQSIVIQLLEVSY